MSRLTHRPTRLALEAHSSWTYVVALLGALTFAGRLGASAQDRPLAYHTGMPQTESLPPARSTSGQGGRGIRLEDILRLREVSELRIAPDGRHVAYAVREARVDVNEYIVTLYIVDWDGHRRPRKVAVSTAITNIRWNPDSRRLTYLGRDGATSGLFQYDVEAGRWKPLPVPATGPIEQYEWSPDSVSLLLLVSDTATTIERRAVAADGIVLGPLLGARDLIDGTWIKRPPHLLLFRPKRATLDTIWTAPSAATGAVPGLAWSPSGTQVAVAYRPSDDPPDVNNIDVGVLTISSRRMTPVVRWPGRESNPLWSPDGSRLAFMSEGDVAGRPHWLAINTIFVAEVKGGQPAALAPSSVLSLASPLGWASDGSGIIFQRSAGATGYVAVVSGDGSGVVRPLSKTEYHLSRCSMAVAPQRLACLRQNATVPPEIAVLDSGGNPRAVTRLNPEYDQIALGDVQELRWKNRYGNQSNGFLLTPPGAKGSLRRPLLVILYGFENAFITQAGVTSYPAQAFAAAGFVVLLMNFPPYHPFRWGGADVETAAFSDRDNPVASIEAAVDTLVEIGIADPSRCGIMGFSTGSYWADLAITRSSRFQAASSEETGARSPTSYWLGDATWKWVQRAIFGGPPAGDSYPRYLQSSPTLMPPPRGIPVLREYESRSLHGLEYTTWQERGGQVEIVFYPQEEHIFVQPVHRLRSMQRNLDWFNFWLRGVENPTPYLAAQYTRWRRMRDALVAAKSGKEVGAQ
jgi:dipeptidyl aminopeptidase/acylaminoacyl peptidase